MGWITFLTSELPDLGDPTEDSIPGLLAPIQPDADSVQEGRRVYLPVLER